MGPRVNLPGPSPLRRPGGESDKSDGSDKSDRSDRSGRRLGRQTRAGQRRGVVLVGMV